MGLVWNRGTAEMAVTTKRRISYELGAYLTGLVLGGFGGYCAIVYLFHDTVRVGLGVTAVGFCLACLLITFLYVRRFRARYSGSAARRPNAGTPAVVRRNMILLVIMGTVLAVTATLNVIAFASGYRYRALLGGLSIVLSLLFAFRLRSYRRSTGKAELLPSSAGADEFQTRIALSLIAQTFLAAAFILAGILLAVLESALVGLLSVLVGFAFVWFMLKSVGRAVKALALPEYSEA